MAYLSRLTRLQRITLILFPIVIIDWLMPSTVGYSLLGGDVFTVFLVVFLVLSSLTLVWPLMRRVLARVKNRSG